MSPSGIGSLANTVWGTLTPFGRSDVFWRVEPLTADNFDLENKTGRDNKAFLILDVCIMVVSWVHQFCTYDKYKIDFNYHRQCKASSCLKGSLFKF